MYKGRGEEEGRGNSGENAGVGAGGVGGSPASFTNCSSSYNMIFS